MLNNVSFKYFNTILVCDTCAKQIVKSGGQQITRQNAAFSDEQKQIVRDSLANGASDQEFAILWEMAKARNLDPLKREVFFVKRWDSQRQREVWSVQISIDGLRVQAARTGEYDGQDETEFEHDDKGNLIAAKTKVYRKGISRPFIGVAHWKEFVQLSKEGKPTSMWASKPHVMLGKCSESIAIRKAFPDETAGLYVEEERSEVPPVPRVEVQPITPKKQTPAPVAVDDPVLEATVVEPSVPSEDDIKYLEFDTRIGSAEWGKEMEEIRSAMKAYYETAGKVIPPTLIKIWKEKRKEVP